MALTEFHNPGLNPGDTYDMDVIAALHNEPNVDDGLTAAQLKAKFDEGGNAIQTYINGTLKNFVDGLEAGTGLADGSVTTAKLADGAVTLAKLAEDAKLVFICSESTGNADILAAVAAGKLPVYRSNDGRDYVYLKKNSSNQAEFFAVDGDTIYTVTRGAFNWTVAMYAPYFLPVGGVPTADIADGAVTAAKIANGTITAAKMASNSVEANAIKPANVLTAKIKDKNVTLAKLEDSVQASLAKADTALQSAHEVPSGGTSGQVLAKASGTDYDVAWVNQSGGGGLPSGGSTGQALVKASATDYDVEWADMQDVYWATYNDTTTLILGTKFSGARFVACKYGDRDYILTEKVSSTDYIFTAVDNGKVYWLENNNNTWTNGSFDIPSLATATPSALGTAAVGSSTKAAKEDHVHAMPSASDVGAVAVAQGVGHAGEFLVVGNDGNVTTVTMTAWAGGSY